MASAVAGMAAAKFTGYVLQWTTADSCAVVRRRFPCAYMVALLVIHVLNPRLEPIKIIAIGSCDP